MAERTLRTLEFTKIREMLAEGALTELGAAKCLALEPFCTLGEAEAAQAETEEAAVILHYVGGHPMTAFPDVREALLEQERLGALSIRRYNQLSPKMLEWILRAEAEEIRKRNLLKAGGPMADYIRQHYPQSWKLAEQEQREHENTVANQTGNMV